MKIHVTTLKYIPLPISYISVIVSNISHSRTIFKVNLIIVIKFKK